MKIKSITDVITNSSTEVFLLETTKSLEEVTQELAKITEGYESPKILSLGDEFNPLQMVYKFGYLYDETKPEDHQRWVYRILEMEDFDWVWSMDRGEMPSEIKEIRELLYMHILDNWTYLDKVITLDSFYDTPLMLGRVCYFGERGDIPFEFLDNFLEKIWNRPLPKELILPEDRKISYWRGKIGFSGSWDNSIPYEDWDKILEEFGGTNFHLG